MSNKWRRVVSLTHGTAMVITDLHGDWDRYSRYRNTFLAARRNGKVQYLIVAGDAIHREAPAEDKSLEIVLDLLDLQDKYPGTIIYLCGNHEMPHIYHFTLARGDILYTPSFEARLGSHRTRIMARFQQLPFYVRTAAGVTITHAGAAAALADDIQCQRLFDFDHQALLDRVTESLKDKDVVDLRSRIRGLSGEDYNTQAQKYLAITGPDDPRYNDLLIGMMASSEPDYQLLWDALFTRCEWDYGKKDYGIFLDAMLKALSQDFYPQRCLVSGHIRVRHGYQIVTDHHLRIASGIHANPLRSAQYLVFDVHKPILLAKDLVGSLRAFDRYI